MSWVEVVEFIEWLISMRGEQPCVYTYYDDINWVRSFINPDMSTVFVE